jgi:hypothetical protein
MDPRVLDAMLPFLSEQFGNPHSRTHSYGWESESAVEDARNWVAKLIGADSKEVIFTSGATESNNMAIKGVSRFYKKQKKHVITTQTVRAPCWDRNSALTPCAITKQEHKCVLDSCRALQQEGFDVTYLGVQQNGLVDIAQLEAAMRPDTVLALGLFHVASCGVGSEVNRVTIIGDRFHHGRKQRDRRGAATQGYRPSMSCAGHLLPHGCRSGCRQDSNRCQRHEDRSAFHQRAQDLRPQGVIFCPASLSFVPDVI